MRIRYRDLHIIEVNGVLHSSVIFECKIKWGSGIKKPIYLEEEDLSESLKYIEGRYKNRNTAIFILMAYCGLRVREVHRLNVKDLKKTRGTIEVLGKGRKWNEIPVPDLLLNYLLEVEKEGFLLTDFRKKHSLYLKKDADYPLGRYRKSSISHLKHSRKASKC